MPEVPVDDLVGADRRCSVQTVEDQVLPLDGGSDLRPEAVGMQQVASDDSDPSDLVGVRRPDAATGRPNGGGTPRLLVEPVEERVVRHHQVSPGADDEVVRRDAAPRQLVHLGEQGLRVERHTRADQAAGLLVEDPGRHEVQCELAPGIDDGVAGVVAALGPDDDVGTTGQQVDDLALTLVTPLATNNGENRHRSTPWRRCADRSAHARVTRRYGIIPSDGASSDRRSKSVAEVGPGATLTERESGTGRPPPGPRSPARQARGR